jgi:hypothetical protein
MKYLELYNSKPYEFELDYLRLWKTINIGVNICLTSAPGMADKRFVDYAAWRLSGEKGVELFTISADEVPVKEILTAAEKGKKQVVVLLPELDTFRLTLEPQLLKLAALDRDHRISFVSVIGVNYLLEPEKYRTISGILGQSMQRQPLSDFSHFTEYLELRAKIHGWELELGAEQVEKLHKLSGGNYRLIKRLGNLAHAAGGVENLLHSELLETPEIKLVLSELASVYVSLPEVMLKKLGITGKTGKPLSMLLQSYLERHNIVPKEELSGKLLKLFNLLYENRGRLVTIDQIENAVRSPHEATLWAIYKLVNRLKKAVAGRYVITSVSGKGYVLDSRF